MDPREVNWRGNKLWEEAIESNACPHDEYDVAETGAIENARVILVYGSGNVDTVDTIGPILLNVGSKVEETSKFLLSIASYDQRFLLLRGAWAPDQWECKMVAVYATCLYALR
ncbi:hypothetical protein V6N11_051202 [Hibiscus sabdariffa]|uniref:Uncharacterized protein n=1 Tax=Hibiscus sabdariffa TaxID=183260 RepID=A0ABR2N8Q4_9ROSI